MKLKKGQGNSEGDLKTQLQIEGKNMRVKEEKKLSRKGSEDTAILWSLRYWFVSIKQYVYIHFVIFRQDYNKIIIIIIFFFFCLKCLLRGPMWNRIQKLSDLGKLSQRLPDKGEWCLLPAADVQRHEQGTEQTVQPYMFIRKAIRNSTVNGSLHRVQEVSKKRFSAMIQLQKLSAFRQSCATCVAEGSV